ncbi:aldehyde dehydrogenase family protein [Govanella unica]|uniref:Aldehyde dehydrogenase family protein n=1 Tax=Govanella unica TaxID=2975056 RepID=A0A9X3Z674_9PROT|nr:aldehyde dehydrogenase family protein [Govania unica]MDA5192900.1 aldehyde dehydrogenase family protein [Govania unica]
MRVRNPRTGSYDYEFTPTPLGDVAATAKRLRANQKAWVARGLEYRIEVLERWAVAVTAERDAIADALTIDTGRALISGREAEGLPRNIRRWLGSAADLMKTELHQSRILPTVTYQNQLVPYALVGAISPWNFPVTLSFIDAIPALVAGSAVILKPSEITPRFVEPIQRSLAAVPELADVFAIIMGDGAIGAELVNHVDAVCFTGSVPTGRKVGEAAARRFIPAFLELGGKDPVIVLDTADIDKATDAVLKGSLLNNGHACLSIERVYVQAPIYDAFVALLTEKAARVRTNAANIHEGEIGPFIHGPQADLVDAQIKDAVQKGARVLTGGVIEDHGGKWCNATVIVDVTHDMAIMRDETFGPIMPVMKFDSIEEAIALANDTEFGLSASVIAGTIDEARAVGAHIDAGGISLNDCGMTYMTFEPEKNSFKFSGMGGSRMGLAGLSRFFRKKAFIMQNGTPQSIFDFSEEHAGK